MYIYVYICIYIYIHMYIPLYIYIHTYIHLYTHIYIYVCMYVQKYRRLCSYQQYTNMMGWYSDSLRAGRSGNRIAVVAMFSTHVQTGPGAHPASCTVGAGLFPGMERPGRRVTRPLPQFSAGVNDRRELYPCSPSGPLAGENQLYIDIILKLKITTNAMYNFMYVCPCIIYEIDERYPFDVYVSVHHI